MFSPRFFSWCILPDFPGLSFPFQPGVSIYPVSVQLNSSLSLCFALPACPDRQWGSLAGRSPGLSSALLNMLSGGWAGLQQNAPNTFCDDSQNLAHIRSLLCGGFKAWVCLWFCAQLQELTLPQARSLDCQNPHHHYNGHWPAWAQVPKNCP